MALDFVFTPSFRRNGCPELQRYSGNCHGFSPITYSMMFLAENEYGRHNNNFLANVSYTRHKLGSENEPQEPRPSCGCKRGHGRSLNQENDKEDLSWSPKRRKQFHSYNKIDLKATRNQSLQETQTKENDNVERVSEGLSRKKSCEGSIGRLKRQPRSEFMKKWRDKVNHEWLSVVDIPAGFDQDSINIHVDWDKVRVKATQETGYFNEFDHKKFIQHVSIPEDVCRESLQVLQPLTGRVVIMGERLKEDRTQLDKTGNKHKNWNDAEKLDEALTLSPEVGQHEDDTMKGKTKDSKQRRAKTYVDVDDVSVPVRSNCEEMPEDINLTGICDSGGPREQTDVIAPIDHLKIQVDVSAFNPENVKVKVEENQVTVTAEQAEEADGCTTIRSMAKTYPLPLGVEHSNVKSTLSEDGSTMIIIASGVFMSQKAVEDTI